MAKKLNQLGCQPNLIISSPAKRTLQTSLVFANELAFKVNNILFNTGIYEASLKDLVIIVNNIPSKHQNVILVGHNPGISELANYLTGNPINFAPTCSIIKIELEINNWNEIVGDIGLEKFFIYPKLFN